jgi:prepilin-type N-terminal cleavage/methylation domain-containing protein
MTHRQTTTRRKEPGFTLTEVLVVIAIIAVVMGLILGGVSKLKESAKESHARTLLVGLLGSEGMYETATTKAIHHYLSDIIDWTAAKRQNAPNYSSTFVITGQDLAGNANDFDDYTDATYSNAMNDFDMAEANLYTERFIWAANQMPTIRKMLPSLGDGFDDIELDGNNVPSGDGFLEVVDPWGNPVAYAASVKHDPLGFTNDDFLPEHNAPFFASAGKDQRWGRPQKRGDFLNDTDWQTYKDSDAYRFTLDNLYSFDLDRSAATRED